MQVAVVDHTLPAVPAQPRVVPSPLRGPADHSDEKGGVDDGARTHDGRNHNPGLYQLSYVHH